MLLREKDRQRLLQIFSSIKYPVAIWAYGSRVNGKAHAGSDLDLVIRSHDLNPLPFEVLSATKEMIRESNIPILVEVRDWARIPAYFHKYIEQQHELLFDNTASVSNPSSAN